MSERRALEGIRIIDTGTMIAAGSTTTYLADFGAEVIKVEHPEYGDPVRMFGKKKDGKGFYWKSVGRNKRYVTLNLGQPRGQELLKELIKTADVLVENYRPGTFEKWGLGWDSVKEINPHIVMLRLSGFGQTGPYSKLGGFGTVAEGLSGFASVNGFPDKPPCLPHFPLADGVAGIAAALSIMIALHARENDPERKGQYIDQNLCDPLMRLLETHFLAYDQLGTITGRNGNRSSNAAPRNAYQTKEGGWVAMSASTQNIATNVMKAIGRPELIEDPRFATNTDRVKNNDELDAIIAEWVGRHTKAEVLKAFSEAKAVIGSIHNMKEAMEDPQFVHRGTFIEYDDPDFGRMRLNGMLAKFSDTPGEIRWTAPLTKGTDNEAVLKELGLNDADIAQLGQEGIICK